MAQSERKTLGDFTIPDISGSFGGIVAPSIANNNFEIKPSIIQMVQNNQFGGLQGEDSYAHCRRRGLARAQVYCDRDTV